MTRRFLLAFATFAAACSSTPSKPLTVNDLPNIDTNVVLTDIKRLSADEMEGRLPGSKGETLAVQYITDQFKAIGLEPGNPKDGTYVQKVPLVSITPSEYSPLVVKKPGTALSFKEHEDVIAFSTRVTDAIDVKDSEIVFAGYGVQAPEFQWDDFKGMDVKGKTLIVFVNDPPVPAKGDPAALDPNQTLLLELLHRSRHGLPARADHLRDRLMSERLVDRGPAGFRGEIEQES